MKTRTDKALLALLLISFVLESFLLWSLGSGAIYNFLEAHLTNEQRIDLGILQSYLIFAVPILSMFSFQLLLCRGLKRKPLALIPLGIVALAAAMCCLEFLSAKGWDSLGWGILLCACLALALGCALGWAGYGICRLKK